jgi:hypothetical protein
MKEVEEINRNMKETLLLNGCFIIYTLLFILLEGLKQRKSKIGDKKDVHSSGWKV